MRTRSPFFIMAFEEYRLNEHAFVKQSSVTGETNSLSCRGFRRIQPLQSCDIVRLVTRDD